MKIDIIILLLTQRTPNRFTAIIQLSNAKYKNKKINVKSKIKLNCLVFRIA